MSVLIWIQTVWHTDSAPERIFWKFLFWKKSADDKKLPSMWRVKKLDVVKEMEIPGDYIMMVLFRNYKNVLSRILYFQIYSVLAFNLRLIFKKFKCFSLTVLFKMLVIRALFMNNLWTISSYAQTVLNLHCVSLKWHFQALWTLLCLELSCVYSVFTISINVQFNPKPLLFLSTS